LISCTFKKSKLLRFIFHIHYVEVIRTHGPNSPYRDGRWFLAADQAVSCRCRRR
jgi:hypothetical protein